MAERRADESGRSALPSRRRVLAAAAAAALTGGAGMARDLGADPETPWRYLSDRVMGGVSEGRAEMADGAIRLTGKVSTANRGGFIQVRAELAAPPPEGAAGIVLEARGNGERYFVHLRTRGTRLPWQYYQAGFETGPDWRTIRLPFAGFAPSGGLLRPAPRPAEVTSVGLVAYGRDHRAELEVRRLEIY